MGLPSTPKSTSSRLPFLLGGLAALVCAQIFYGALVLSALHKQYSGPTLAVQALVCEELGQRLGRMTRLGKEPERIAGLDSLLAPYAGANTDALLVLDGQNKILAGWSPHHWRLEHGESFIFPEKLGQLQGQVHKFSQGNSQWLEYPLTSYDNSVVGHVLLGMSQDKLSAQVWLILKENIKILASITISSALLLIILLLRLHPRQQGAAQTHFPRKRLYASLIVPLIGGQLFFAATMLVPLYETSAKQLDSVARQLGRHLGGELEHLLRLGLSLQQLPPVSTHLRDLQEFLPQSLGLGIVDAQGMLLHLADRNEKISVTTWNELCQQAIITEVSIVGAQGQKAGSVRVLMSKQAIFSNIRAITLDTLTMTIIAALFLAELVSLLLAREKQRRGLHSIPLANSTALMRMIIFLCMFAIDLSISFVPLRLGELGPNLLGLPTDVVLGLPVSVEMFMVGLAIILGGFWSEKVGWQPVLLTGVSGVALGNLASAWAVDPLMYIGSRGLAGAGYGLLNLSAQLFVLANSKPNERAGNLATVFAGLFAGALCGSASGGLVADRLGYASTFLLASILMALTGLLLWFVLPKASPVRQKDKPAQTLPTLDEILTFVFNPRMAALLFLNIVPSAFVTVCLFQFFIPVSLNQSGASPADIGRVVMLFPLVIVYLGPFFGRLVDNSSHKYRSLALAGLIVSGSVAVLLVLDGLLAATVAVALLGVGNAVLSNAQGAYALELPASQHFGPARAVGLYNAAERLGQVLGPVSLGFVLVAWGRSAGLGLMALGFALSSVFFAILSQKIKAK